MDFNIHIRWKSTFKDKNLVSKENLTKTTTTTTTTNNNNNNTNNKKLISPFFKLFSNTDSQQQHQQQKQQLPISDKGDNDKNENKEIDLEFPYLYPDGLFES